MDINEVVAQYMKLTDQYADMKPFTEEWWAVMKKSLIFVPEEYREMSMIGVVMTGSSM